MTDLDRAAPRRGGDRPGKGEARTAGEEALAEDREKSAEPASEDPSIAQGLLRTAEVLKRTGITHQVLYRYVTLGIIEPTAVSDTGVRLFRPQVVPLIKIIQGMTKTGYSLRDLKETFFLDKNVRRLLGRK